MVRVELRWGNPMALPCGELSHPAKSFRARYALLPGSGKDGPNRSVAGIAVPTSAHHSRYIRSFASVGALPPLGKSFLLATIANLSSNLAASQAGRRRF